MEEIVRYYILFQNSTQGLELKELFTAAGIKSRIAPAPRSIQGELSCGVSLLVEEEYIAAARACIEEHQAPYHDIVPLAGEIRPGRNRFC